MFSSVENGSLNQITSLIGRILLIALFIFSGVGKIAAPAATQGYIAAMGLPLPGLAYLSAIILEIGFGLAFLLGYKTRLAAVVLAAYTVLTAVAFHAHFADQNQLIQFLKNVSIAGGFLQVAVLGGGAYSLDARVARSVPPGEAAYGRR